jgi:hypothetical protein
VCGESSVPDAIEKLPGEPIAVLSIDQALNNREEGMQMDRDIGTARDEEAGRTAAPEESEVALSRA